MADSTDSTAPDPEDDTTPNRYTLRASIAADGSLQLSGDELRNNTIEVPRGEDAVIRIVDANGYFVYGAELPPRGERAGCWGRNTTKGLARRKFEAVTQDVHSVVFAADTNTTTEIKYGPVITVKPKG